MDFVFDSSLLLYLPLFRLDGVSFGSKGPSGQFCVVTGALWTPQGRSLDGVDDKIECGNGVNVGSAATWEAWLKPDTIVGVPRIISKNSAYLIRLINSDEVNFYLWTILGEAGITSTTSPLADFGSWRHIAATYDDTDDLMKLYANGNEIKSVAHTFGGPVAVNSSVVAIGSDPGANWYDGMLGEVRIYNRRLSGIEIQQNYLATKWRYR